MFSRTAESPTQISLIRVRISRSGIKALDSLSLCSMGARPISDTIDKVVSPLRDKIFAYYTVIPTALGDIPYILGHFRLSVTQGDRILLASSLADLLATSPLANATRELVHTKPHGPRGSDNRSLYLRASRITSAIKNYIKSDAFRRPLAADAHRLSSLFEGVK